VDILTLGSAKPWIEKSNDIQAAHPFATFEPGARTPLGTSHPLEQVLNVLSGLGRVPREGGPTGRLTLATRFWIEPGKRQCHGSTPGRVFVHLAVQEATLSGEEPSWFDHQYRETPDLGGSRLTFESIVEVIRRFVAHMPFADWTTRLPCCPLSVAAL
jgi:hypothetical protein